MFNKITNYRAQNGTLEHPARSCRDIQLEHPEFQSGLYQTSPKYAPLYCIPLRNRVVNIRVCRLRQTSNKRVLDVLWHSVIVSYPYGKNKRSMKFKRMRRPCEDVVGPLVCIALPCTCVPSRTIKFFSSTCNSTDVSDW